MTNKKNTNYKEKKKVQNIKIGKKKNLGIV
jgi:hypothetical protein